MKQAASKLLCMVLAVLVLAGIMAPAAEAAGSAAIWFDNGISVTWDTHWTLGNAKYYKYAGDSMYMLRFGESSSNVYAYCIEPGYDVYTGEHYQSGDTSEWWSAMGTLKQRAINLALYYGFPNNTALNGSTAEKWAATQAIVWEIVCGYRGTSTTSFARTDNRFYLMCSGYSGFETAYGQIASALENHYKIPSFSGARETLAPIIDLTYNTSTGKYSATVTDTNGVLSNYSYSMSGVTFTRNGNSLTITADAPIQEATPVSCTKTMLYGAGEPAVIWTGLYDESRQEVVSGKGQPDPVPSYIRVRAAAATGSLEITKTFEGQTSGVSGVPFLVTGPNGYSQTHTTDASGKITITNLPVGTYTVTEQSCAANTAYVLAAAQTATVTYGGTAKLTIHNTLKKWRVTVTKTDDTTGTAQGDASLAGAVYGIYQGDTLLDSYTTDANGSFTTKYYTCGTNYTLREITPSEGYLLDPTSYAIGAAPGSFTAEHNTVTMGVTEEVIMGRIGITKHTDSGLTRIETPEVGAKFQVYLKSFGSYDAAPEAYRDEMTANLDGYMESKDLPYGTYTVHQTWSWPGRELAADFDVVIGEDGKVYRYILNNAAFYAYAKILKTDAETGDVIPYAGAAFEIYDPDGNKVEFEVTYPEHETISTFYTTADGSLITPGELIYGEGYTLVEVTAPYGYVLDPTPISFDVTEENSTTEGTLTVIEVVRANTAQKGTIEIEKTGEGFATVTEDNGRYTPVYAAVGLTGAVYEIRAAEDIVTPDGTLRYAEGSLVDTITTDGDGKAESIPLYLGKYELTEITAPYGYVLDDTPIAVELVYADQTVTLTRTGVSATNDRQTLTVTLYKDLEEDELFEIGTGDEILNVYFGLYAAAEITAADGTKIPADGLIELAGVTAEGKLTFASDLPFGSYYVQEAAVGDAYLLSAEKYPVEFVYNGQEQAAVEIEINSGNAIFNQIIRGDIEGLKTDNETEEPLPGALIGLFRADATEFTEDTALMTDTSAEDGSFSFESVPYGLWIVREIAAPEGYALSDKSYEAAVGTDGQLIEIEIVNTRIRGSVVITKVDVSNGETLPDTGVRILDEEGNVIVKGRTDENGVVEFNELPFGKYYYQEFDAPEGYVIDEGLYAFEVTEHGQIVRAEMSNRMISSEIVITKVDSQTGTALYRAGIRFLDAEGNTIAEGYTDENGVFSTILTYGAYEYYEFAAPEGYVLDTTRHKVTVTEDGAVIEETLRNDAKAEIVYTGDRSNLALWVCISGISVCAAAALFIYSRARRYRPHH